MLDPARQECIGLYLYGAGFYARDENTLRIVTNQESPPHFCLTCPARKSCEQRHEEHVRGLAPEAAEFQDRMVAEGARRGIGRTIVAAKLADQGRNPFAIMAIANYKQGHADRGRRDGVLIK